MVVGCWWSLLLAAAGGWRVGWLLAAASCGCTTKRLCNLTITKPLYGARDGIEPVRTFLLTDLKSCVSTIPPPEPKELSKKPLIAERFEERKTRLELATLTLARLCSTN